MRRRDGDHSHKVPWRNQDGGHTTRRPAHQFQGLGRRSARRLQSRLAAEERRPYWIWTTGSMTTASSTENCRPEHTQTFWNVAEPASEGKEQRMESMRSVG